MDDYSSASEMIDPSKFHHLWAESMEKATLGVMLAQPDLCDEIAEHLASADFFAPAHKELFECFMEMRKSLIPIEVETAHHWLTQKDKAERLKSPGVLSELLISFSSHLNIWEYVKVVKEKSLLRSLVDKAAKIVQDAQENPDDVAGVIDRAESSILSVNSTLQREGILDAKAAVKDFREYLVEVNEGRHVPMLATGIKSLDAINGGFPCPGYVVIAAPPGGGKTAMMMTLNENWCSQGIGVVNFSLEMTNRKLIQRRVANRAKMDSRTMNRKLDMYEMARVQAALDDIEDTPFWVDESSNLALTELRPRLREAVKSGAKVAILDYVQKLRGHGSGQNKIDQLTEASWTASVLQKEFGILFIMLAQITRKAQEEGNYKAYHIADCAGISNDARMILMLEPKPHPQGELGVWPKDRVPLIGRLAKVSDGEDGDIELIFNQREQRIS